MIVEGILSWSAVPLAARLFFCSRSTLSFFIGQFFFLGLVFDLIWLIESPGSRNAMLFAFVVFILVVRLDFISFTLARLESKGWCRWHRFGLGSLQTLCFMMAFLGCALSLSWLGRDGFPFSYWAGEGAFELTWAFRSIQLYSHFLSGLWSS